MTALLYNTETGEPEYIEVLPEYPEETYDPHDFEDIGRPRMGTTMKNNRITITMELRSCLDATPADLAHAIMEALRRDHRWDVLSIAAKATVIPTTPADQP